jgi:hypothetical protein
MLFVLVGRKALIAMQRVQGEVKRLGTTSNPERSG